MRDSVEFTVLLPARIKLKDRSFIALDNTISKAFTGEKVETAIMKGVTTIAKGVTTITEGETTNQTHNKYG